MCLRALATNASLSPTGRRVASAPQAGYPGVYHPVYVIDLVELEITLPAALTAFGPKGDSFEFDFSK